MARGFFGGAVMLSLTMSAQTFTTLYNFGSRDQDGTVPYARVIRGPQGELYGTTIGGGEWNFGTVYELLPPASPGGSWTEVVLRSFDGQDGESPHTGLAMGPSGAFYGVTITTAGGCGTAFGLDPPTATSTHWPETVLYQFTGVNGNPSGALVFGLGESLYGATAVDDTTQTVNGTVYSLSPPTVAGGASTEWTQETLYSFPGGSGGSNPLGTLAVSGNGTLFGVTTYGGRINSVCGFGCGTVFSLTPPAISGGPWTQKVLYGFEPQIGDGYHPIAGVVLAPTGVLYGTTVQGGVGTSGTVFSLTPPPVTGMPMTETILHAFTGPDGFEPDGSLVLGPNGVLYGTTEEGGSSNLGTVFELAPPASPGGSRTETILHNFAGGADGYNPNGVALGSNGTLYGTTVYGGASIMGRCSH
jgi:uncharacterized repeat protein (TIGR03803 family)